MSDAGRSVGIIMGSQSDWETMRHAAGTLDRLGIGYETRIVSAHRTPERLYDYARTAKSRGLRLIIAGAGGAAHLPGMTAALTPLPVLGVPIESRTLKGVDSLLSIVQMPAGVPVATFAIGQAGAINAALFAAAMLGLTDMPPRRLSTAGGRRRQQVSPTGPTASGMLAPGRDDRHIGGRPARPDDGARRRPARLSLPCLRRRARQPGRASLRRGHRCRIHRPRGARAVRQRASTSRPSSSKIFPRSRFAGSRPSSRYCRSPKSSKSRRTACARRISSARSTSRPPPTAKFPIPRRCSARCAISIIPRC